MTLTVARVQVETHTVLARINLDRSFTSLAVPHTPESCGQPVFLADCGQLHMPTARSAQC